MISRDLFVMQIIHLWIWNLYKKLSNDINAPIHLSIVCDNFDFWFICQGHHEFYDVINLLSFFYLIEKNNLCWKKFPKNFFEEILSIS